MIEEIPPTNRFCGTFWNFFLFVLFVLFFFFVVQARSPPKRVKSTEKKNKDPKCREGSEKISYRSPDTA